MRKYILLLLAMSTMAWTAQPAFHSMFAYNVIEQGKKQFDLGLFNAPIYGIASHMAADRLIGESAIDYQLDIAGVREVIMYCNTPDDQKTTFLVDAFWGLFPDIYDKVISPEHPLFHGHFQDSQIFPMDKGATDMLEELSVLMYTVKVNF